MEGVGVDPTYLSTLVDGQPEDVALLLALCAMRCWGEKGTTDTRDPMLAGISATDQGTDLKLEWFTMPDLVLERPILKGGPDAVG